MFWKYYSAVTTIAVAVLYAHIRHVEGWMKGMEAAITAELKNEETSKDVSD